MKNLKWIFFACALAMTGCGDDDKDTPAVECGQGDLIAVEGTNYCVYPQAVVVENGFDCPAVVPNLTIRGPIGVCSDRPMLPNEELEQIDEIYGEVRPDIYEDEVECSIDSECAGGQTCEAGSCVASNDECGGRGGSTCASDEFCNFAPDAECGATDKLGTCEPRPDAQECTEPDAPVCGCDGQTYGSACDANASGVSVASQGECASDCTIDGCAAEQTCVEGTCLPACGGFAGLTCASEEWCDFPDGSFCGGADELGACRPRPDSCNQVVEEVCGCDGSTYTNRCIANSEGVDVSEEGACP